MQGIDRLMMMVILIGLIVKCRGMRVNFQRVRSVQLKLLGWQRILTESHTSFMSSTRLFTTLGSDDDGDDDFEGREGAKTHGRLEDPKTGRISKRKKLNYMKDDNNKKTKQTTQPNKQEKGKTRKSVEALKLGKQMDSIVYEEEIDLPLVETLDASSVNQEKKKKKTEEREQVMKGLVIERYLDRFLIQKLTVIPPSNHQEDSLGSDNARLDEEEEEEEEDDESDDEDDNDITLASGEKPLKIPPYQHTLQINHTYSVAHQLQYNLDNYFICSQSTKMIIEQQMIVPGDFITFTQLNDTPTFRIPSNTSTKTTSATVHETFLSKESNEQTPSFEASSTHPHKNRRIPPFPSLPLSQYPTGFITNLLPRFNLLQRPTSSHESRKKIILKSIASNIHQIFILISTRPSVPLPTIDRYLITARLLNIPKVYIIVNKFDLGQESLELYHELLFYENILQTKILCTSVETKYGIKELKDLLINQTSIFVGQSGVGKSSLINALLPHLSLKVNPLMKNERFGSHTTSNAKLYHFYDDDDEEEEEAGVIATEEEVGNKVVTDATKECTKPAEKVKPLRHGMIIDSPGIREFGTWHLTLPNIIKGFKEIDYYSKQCKFRNCNHLAQNKDSVCAVQRALKNGDIHELRYRSFVSLLKQIGYEN